MNAVFVIYSYTSSVSGIAAMLIDPVEQLGGADSNVPGSVFFISKSDLEIFTK
jgi:hypothetical protein